MGIPLLQQAKIASYLLMTGLGEPIRDLSGRDKHGRLHPPSITGAIRHEIDWRLRKKAERPDKPPG